MPTFNFVNSGGGTFRLKDRDSAVIGAALENSSNIPAGSVFKPATGVDRDALVDYLVGLDYTARLVEVVMSYDVPGEGIYTLRARRSDTQDELDAWIEEEREAMAKRLGLKDPLDITVTVTEV